jgi:hypothetical protein
MVILVQPDPFAEASMVPMRNVQLMAACNVPWLAIGAISTTVGGRGAATPAA